MKFNGLRLTQWIRRSPRELNTLALPLRSPRTQLQCKILCTLQSETQMEQTKKIQFVFDLLKIHMYIAYKVYCKLFQIIIEIQAVNSHFYLNKC